MIKIILFLFLFQTSFAKKVLLQSDEISFIEYASYLQSNKDWKSYSFFKSNKYPSAKNRSEIFSLFTQAQKSYLNDDLKTAEEKYKKVISMKFSDDWSQAERKLIFHSFLRLALIDKDNQNQWIRYSIFFDSSLIPETSTFSPYFHRKWIKEKNLLKVNKLHLNRSFLKKFPIVKINGKIVKDRKISYHKGEMYRIHLFSNKYKSILMISNLNDINNIKRKKLLVKGNCIYPQFKTHETKWALFSENCLAEKKVFRTDFKTDVLNKKNQKEEEIELLNTHWFSLMSVLGGFFIYQLSSKQIF